MQTLVDGFQSCNAKHILLVLDCCYAGHAAQRGGEPLMIKNVTEDFIKMISARRAIQVLAAGQEDEPVSDSGTRVGFSAFTGALLDILESERDLDDNGILTAHEIGLNLERLVALQQGSFQRPAYNTLAGSKGGDFIFKIFNI